MHLGEVKQDESQEVRPDVLNFIASRFLLQCPVDLPILMSLSVCGHRLPNPQKLPPMQGAGLDVVSDNGFLPCRCHSSVPIMCCGTRSSVQNQRQFQKVLASSQNRKACTELGDSNAAQKDWAATLLPDRRVTKRDASWLLWYTSCMTCAAGGGWGWSAYCIYNLVD